MYDLTLQGADGTPSDMLRKKLFPVRITLPLTEKMIERIDATLEDGETRVDAIRAAIATELRKREKPSKG